jgi:FkbM family methyltransferase
MVPEEVKNGICVDIGANVGNFFKKYKNYFSLIHFYEPYKECFDICNQEEHTNILGFNEAVIDKIGFVELVSHINNESGSNAIKGDNINEEWTSTIVQDKVKSVDLETVLSRVGGKINYLKCDAETSEYSIFLNKELKNIEYIALEIHHQMGQIKYDELLNFISQTHELYSGDKTYLAGSNKELLFKRK